MIDIQHSNERNFCGAITPKEKDKIMKAKHYVLTPI